MFLIFCLIFVLTSEQLFSLFFFTYLLRNLSNGLRNCRHTLLHPYWLTCRVFTKMLTKHTIDLSVFSWCFILITLQSLNVSTNSFYHCLVFKCLLLLSNVEWFTWKSVAIKYSHFVDRAVFTHTWRLNSWLSAVLQQSFPIQVFLWMKLKTGSVLWLMKHIAILQN